MNVLWMRHLQRHTGQRMFGSDVDELSIDDILLTVTLFVMIMEIWGVTSPHELWNCAADMKQLFRCGVVNINSGEQEADVWLKITTEVTFSVEKAAESFRGQTELYISFMLQERCCYIINLHHFHNQFLKWGINGGINLHSESSVETLNCWWLLMVRLVV